MRLNPTPIAMRAISLTLATCLVGAAPSPAAALAPAQTGWWSASNRAGQPAVPPPPDVDTAKHDLFVQGFLGTNGSNPAPLPANNAQGGAQALAAVRYQLAEGEAPTKLTLKFKGAPPGNTPSVVLCVVTASNFKAEDNGPVEDIPTYDCGVQVAGKLSSSGDGLEYADLGKLTRGQVLQVMVVPGTADRVVFLQPDASALQVAGAPTAPPPVPVTAGVPNYSTPAGSSAGAGSSGAAPVVAAPYSAIVGELPLPAPLPVQAPAKVLGRTVARAPLGAGARSSISGSDVPTRWLVAFVALAAVAAFIAMAVLGPRMNPNLAGAAADGELPLRGIGRFARARAGQPPRLS